MRPGVHVPLRAALLVLLAVASVVDALGGPSAWARLLGLLPGLLALVPVSAWLEQRARRSWIGFAWVLLFDLFLIGFCVGESSPTLVACLLLGAVAATARTTLAGGLVGCMAAVAAGVLYGQQGATSWTDPRLLSLVPLYPALGLLAGFLSRQADRAWEQVAELREDLAEQAEQINNVLACVASGVLVLDAARRVTTFNNAAARILGLPQHTVVGRELAAIPALEPLRPALETPRAGGEAHRQDLEFERPDGGRIFVGYATSPLEDRAGRRLGLILVFQDVTLVRDYADRMLRQEQLAALGRMVSGIAHEFGNLLGGAQGLLEVALAEPPEEAVQSLPIVRETLARALETVNHLLRFARGTPLNRSPGVQLGAVLERALQLTRLDLERGGVAVETRLEEELPPLAADAGQLEQVFINLILNALHAVQGQEDRRLRITISREQQAVVARFEDSGPGVPPGLRERVFEPFFTTKGALGGSPVPGTGLGLSMALGVVQGHEGSMDVSTSPDLKGACFAVVLPSTNGEGSAST